MKLLLRDTVEFTGHHNYVVKRKDTGEVLLEVKYQKGARTDEKSRPGVLDLDLLFMVRDRLKTFQEGPFACKENEITLQKVEEAIMWSEKRVKDREDRKVLGTYEK